MVMSPVLVQSQDLSIAPPPPQTSDLLAPRRVIARLLTRIISRAYGSIDEIVKIDVGNDGLIKCLFRDDDKDRKLIRLELGDRIEYKQVQNGRTDAVSTDADQYLVAYANSIGQRTDKISKPKNCTIGTSCKGSCIAKGDICRVDPPEVLNKKELSDLNDAVIQIQTARTPTLSIPSEDPYEGLNIRQLKEAAREKGILRYSYMTQDQLKGALKVYDQDPDFQENIRKGLQRVKDEATLKKVKTTEVGRAISSINPTLGRQFNVISAIGKKYENNPDEARILALSAIFGIAATAAKTVASQRKANIEEAKTEASSMARDLRPQTNQVPEDNIVFVVGSHKSGSGALANGLTQSSNISSEDRDWLNKEARVIPISREKEGMTPDSDPIRAVGDSLVTGYKATIGNLLTSGRGAEATALAAKLFVQGSTYFTDGAGIKKIPSMNILAAEDGGTVARDALEILRKIPKSPDSNGFRGSDVAERIHLVTLGTPYFGLAKPNVPEANIMGDGDLWALTPFTKGGSETKKVSGVSGSEQRSYLESSEAMDSAFRHMRSVEKERRFIDADSAKKALASVRGSLNPEMAEDVLVEARKRAAVLGKSEQEFLADEKALGRAIRSVEAKRRAARKIKIAQTQFGVNTDSAYIQGREDAYRKIKCRSGYVQRGAACRKQSTTPNTSSITSKKRGRSPAIEVKSPSNAMGNLLKFGLPIASVAAIALTGKTVVDDIKKVTQKIEPDEIFLKAGEPIPKKVLDLYDKEFKPGDLIKRKSMLNGLYIEHYGIYAGNGKIIETYGKDEFGGSTLLKGDIGRPSESDGTRYVKVEDISDKAKPPSREQALKLAESMVGVPIKFDGVETNCEAIARLITQGEARTSQGEKLSWVTKSIGRIAAMKFGGKNLDKGFSAQEVSEMMKKSKYDPVLVQAIFADSVTQRKKDIAAAARGDSNTVNVLSQLRSPEDFTRIVDKTTQPLGGASKNIVEQQMYKAYLVGAFSLASKKTARNNSEEYRQGRLDALKKLKCKAGYIQRGAACQKERATDERTASREGFSLSRAAESISPVAAVVAGYIGISYLDEKYHLQDKALQFGLKQSLSLGGAIDRSLEGSSLDLGVKTEAKKLIGMTKLAFARAVLERGDTELIDVDTKANNFTYRDKKDGGVVTLASVGSTLFSFVSQRKDQAGIPNTKIYDISFQINMSHDKKESDTLGASGAKQIIRLTKGSFDKHIKSLPDNSLLMTSAFDKDGLGGKRQSIYERVGFAPMEGQDSKNLFAAKKNGRFYSISELMKLAG